MKDFVKVDMVVSPKKVLYKLTPSKGMKKCFLGDEFFVEYDEKIDEVDESILAIPITSIVAPIAWLFGADIHVKKLDKNYLSSINTIQKIYGTLYSWPNLSSSNIIIEDVVFNKFDEQRTGMLFTGGVDSLTSYLRHKKEKPELFSIWEIPFLYTKDEWERRKKLLQNFAKSEKTNIHFIKACFGKLNLSYLGVKSKFDWWSQVVHSLVLTGLCAPLTVLESISTLYIASSYKILDTRVIERAWLGANPLVDNKIRWANTKVIHDSHDLNRMEKVKYLKEFPSYLGYLVCETGSLFSEKTTRTITELVLAGIDPNKCLSNGDVKEILRHFRKNLSERRVQMDEDIKVFWKDIQENIPNNFPENIDNETQEFLTWLKNFNFTKYREKRTLSYLSYIRKNLSSNFNYYFPETIYWLNRFKKKFLPIPK